jgi:hypothetical protein
MAEITGQGKVLKEGRDWWDFEFHKTFVCD